MKHTSLKSFYLIFIMLTYLAVAMSNNDPEQTTYPFIGKTYIEYYGPDTIYSNRYISDTQLEAASLTGPNKGKSQIVNYNADKIMENIYLVSWQESNGATVTLVIDFKKEISWSKYTSADLNFYQDFGPYVEGNSIDWKRVRSDSVYPSDL